MAKSNDKKSKLLGMPVGTASGRLKKELMYSLVKELNKHFCYRCNNTIESAADMSIDHKEPWLSAEDPIISFFDLNNVAFSHLSCNSKAASHPNKRWKSKKERREHRNSVQKEKWQSLSQEDQTERRRKRYEMYGC